MTASTLSALQYDVRVNPASGGVQGSESQATTGGSHLGHIILVSGGLLTIFGLYLKDKYKAKKRSKSKNTTHIAAGIFAFLLLGALSFQAVHIAHVQLRF